LDDYNGYNLDIVNAVPDTKGYNNKSFLFNGKDAYLKTPFNSNVSQGTITAWVWANDSLAVQKEIMGTRSLGVTEFDFYFLSNALNGILGDGTTTILTSNIPNRWVFVAVSWNLSNFTLRLNDSYAYGFNNVSNIAELNFTIGARRRGAVTIDAFFNGSIDELLYFNKYLTNTELDQIKNLSYLHIDNYNFNSTDMSNLSLSESNYSIKLICFDNASKTATNEKYFKYSDTLCPVFNWFIPLSSNQTQIELFQNTLVNLSVFDINIKNMSVQCMNNATTVLSLTNNSPDKFTSFLSNYTLNLTSEQIYFCNATASDNKRICYNNVFFTVKNTSVYDVPPNTAAAVTDLAKVMLWIFLLIIWIVLLAIGFLFMLFFLMVAGLYGIFLSFVFMHAYATMGFIFIAVNVIIFIVGAVALLIGDEQ
jgi:hypothetical protein